MNHYLPRYIYGMLRTPDKQNVFGDLRPIAYSVGFSDELQREVYEKIKLGLNREILKNTDDAYGFFSFQPNTYIAAHYHLMDLTEPKPISRGKPVFAEYLFITETQLSDLKWNLIPVFKTFQKIDYYDQVVRDLPSYQITDDFENEWFDYLLRYSAQIEAVLVRYLSSTQKINITSAPEEPEVRLKFLCALVQTLHARYRNGISFTTLASSATQTAKIFFSSGQSGNGQIVEWTKPTIPNLSGAVFANWMNDEARRSNSEGFIKAIQDMDLPWETKYLNSFGEELDLAIKYKIWYANRDEHLKTRVLNQLEELARQINEFSCILTPDEARNWLSFLLVFLIKVTAYDISAQSLSHYMFMITDSNTRRELAKKIAYEIFHQQKDEEFRTLVEFIVFITEHSVKTNQSLLVEFCKEIVLQCLSSKDTLNALKLWEKIRYLDWANSTSWFQSALEAIPTNANKEDFIFIVNKIKCPANKQAFDALLTFLQKSSSLSRNLQQNIRFLENSENYDAQKYVVEILKSYPEVGSYAWLGTQIKFGYDTFSDFSERLPHLVNSIDEVKAKDLIQYTISEKDELLTVFIVFSRILNQTKSDNLKTIDNDLVFVMGCHSEYINIGLEILQNHWKLFSVEQLISMLNLLNSKSRTYPNINLSIVEINITIQKKNRIEKIKKVFQEDKKRGNLKYFVSDFIFDFSRSADMEAWMLFVEYLRDNGYLDEYRRLLIQILLERKFFNIDNDKLKRLSALLGDAKLTYEADVFVYWLFFQRGISINAIPTILRTLSLSHVLPTDAGKIIGQEYVFDKKYIRYLANKLIQMDIVEVRRLTKELDDFIVRQATSSFENKIRALVSDLPSDVIWAETCKLLSKSIKLEMKKNKSWRS